MERTERGVAAPSGPSGLYRSTWSMQPGRGGRWRILSVVAVAILLLAGLGYLTLIAPNLWQSYTDPAAGFSIRYPPGWLLDTSVDGSHPPLINPSTRATISVYAATVSGSAGSVLNSVVPPNASTVQHREVAGDAALDFVLPGSPAGGSGATDPGLLLSLHMVVVAAANTAGSMNEYTLMLSEPPSANSSSDDALFEQVVGTFSPGQVSSWLPLLGNGGAPRPIGSVSSADCNSICWADSNWNVNDYSADASGQACAGFDDNSGDYVSCTSQVLSTLGAFQPNYQCSEFVSRALAQSGLLPGLASGGYSGVTPATSTVDQFGSYSYNSYPFTFAGDAGDGDSVYNLLGVGTTGTPGLYDYLLDSGIGVSLHQDVAEAEPGDVVFFYTGSLDAANREHVMLITGMVRYPSASQGFGGWDALLDGHNRAVYHSLLSALTGQDYPFEIVHLAARRGTSYRFATHGSGWGPGSDANQEPLVAVTTTSSATPTASAQIDLGQSGACELAAYIPNVDATATVSFQVTRANGHSSTSMIDESAVDGWVLLQEWSPPGSGPPPSRVTVTNATGSDTDTLGLGPVVALCAAGG